MILKLMKTCSEEETWFGQKPNELYNGHVEIHSKHTTYVYSLWYISFLKVAFWLCQNERAKVTEWKGVGAEREKSYYNGREMWATSSEFLGRCAKLARRKKVSF